jgi:transposase
MGGEKNYHLPRIGREQILNAYKAGPDAVISLIEYLQDQHDNAIDQLLELIRKLTKRIEALEQKNGKDSHNSDKPPSSDGLHRQIHKRRESSGKKPGGQEGHEGTTLPMVKHPQRVQIHEVKSCNGCGRSLQQEKPRGYEPRQVFDIPPIVVEVTEHRGQIKRCPHCGKISVAAFPAEVSHKTQYGTRLKAFAVYLKNYGLLPYDRTAQALANLFCIPLSVGTLVSIDQRCAQRVQAVVEQIRQKLIHAKVVHFDETGLSINGKLHWLHGAGTQGFTYYYPHERRGTAATDQIGILPRLKGNAVHDNWKPYMKYGCSHSLCNAHHIRELTRVYEQGGQPWAQQMIGLLLESKQTVEQAKRAGKKSLPLCDIRNYESRYQTIIANGMKANPPPHRVDGPGRRGRLKRTKARNLLERLARLRNETLRFLTDFRVPFDNNLAERDIRMMRVQQKVSGAFRSYQGALSFCRIRSYISTIRKQGMSVIDAIMNAFEKDLTLTDCLQNS